MAKTYDLMVRARGDSRDAQRAMAQLQKKIGTFGKNVRNVGLGMTASLTLPIIAAARVGIAEVIESSKVSAATAAVLKSTGKSAQFSARHIETLAGKMAMMSGIDDEVIQGAENILLRFDGINKKNFGRVTRSMVDMVAAGKSADSVATALGIAMSSPEKAMGRLTKQGVGFTKMESERIKKLAESNKIGQAQELILRKVEKAYGGQAAALGQTPEGKINRLKIAFEEIAGAMATFLVPAFEWLAIKLEIVQRWFEGLSPRMQRFIAIGALIVAVIGPLVVIVGTLITALGALAPVIGAISGTAVAVIAAIVAVGSALVTAYARSETFRNRVNRAFQAVRREVSSILGSLRLTIAQWGEWGRAFWNKYGADITRLAGRAFATLSSIIGPYLRAAANVIRAILAVMRGDFGEAWDQMKSAAKNAGTGILNAIQATSKALIAVVRRIPGAVKGLLGAFRSAGEAIGRGLKSAIISALSSLASAVANLVRDAVTGAVNKAKSAIPDPQDFLPGWARSKKGAGGVNVFGALVGSSVSLQQVLGYSDVSSGQAYSQGSDGSVTPNKAVISFLKKRIEQSKARIRLLLKQRQPHVGKLKRKRKELRGLFAARKRAVAAGKPVKPWDTKIKKLQGVIASIEGTIEYYDSEIMSLGGQIDSDQEALEPPDDNSGDTGGGDTGGGDTGTDTSTGTTGTTGTTTSTGGDDGQLALLQQQLFASQQNQAASEAALAAFGGPGDIGNGLGMNAWQSATSRRATQIHFHSTVPYTQEQARMVAQMTRQGYETDGTTQRINDNRKRRIGA